MFGFLGAGATSGQLAGSLIAGLLSRLSRGSQLEASPASAVRLQLTLMLLAALLLEVAGNLAGRLKRIVNATDDVGVSLEGGIQRKV